MAKKINNLGIVALALIGILFVGTLGLFSIFGELPGEGIYLLPVFPVEQDGTGSCVNTQIYVDNGWTSGESTIKTEKSTFRIVTSEIETYDNPRTSTATVTYKVQVFKDNILIDTINKLTDSFVIPSGTPGIDSVAYGQIAGDTYGPNPTTQIYYRAYSDDGLILKSEEVTPRLFIAPNQVVLPDETGINIIFGYSSVVSSVGCGKKAYVMHKLEIIGETDTLSTDGFINVNGVDIFPDGNDMANFNQHSEVKIINIGIEQEEPECTENEEDCSGTVLIRCENNAWANKGEVDGKCGYEIEEDDVDDEDDAEESSFDLDQVLFNLGDFEITFLILLISVGGLIIILIIKK